MTGIDTISEEQFRKIKAKLLGYDAPPKTTVEVRRRRFSKAVSKPKPHIEVQPRRCDLGGEWLYDFFLVSERGRYCVQNGLHVDEARTHIKIYQQDSSEVRVIK